MLSELVIQDKTHEFAAEWNPKTTIHGAGRVVEPMYSTGCSYGATRRLWMGMASMALAWRIPGSVRLNDSIPDQLQAARLYQRFLMAINIMAGQKRRLRPHAGHM